MLISVFVDPDTHVRQYLTLQDTPRTFDQLRTLVHRQLYLDHKFTNITHYFERLTGVQCGLEEGKIDTSATWSPDKIMQFVRKSPVALVYFYELSQEEDDSFESGMAEDDQ